ncbi:MAG: DUF4381 domain-containing protein [Pseudomonadota bacterium]
MNPADIPIRDLHLPPEIGWWPLAPGWWVLLAIAVILVALALRALRRRLSASRARRFALRQLEQAKVEYQTHGNLVMLGTTLSELLRRTMLAYAPRAEVAGLSGDAWAAWLDRGLPQPLFSKGEGRAMLELPYRNPKANTSDVNVEAMLAAVQIRLRTPLEDDS